jgi:hypothetical protein
MIRLLRQSRKVRILTSRAADNCGSDMRTGRDIEWSEIWVEIESGLRLSLEGTSGLVLVTGLGATELQSGRYQSAPRERWELIPALQKGPDLKVAGKGV